ncbi:1-deoxy-D-xylulose-5-phosphate synthase [Amycolatopsis aidingensis]|uniref:1-deoxy-D-xylulose-5-phosphate synthase n=1 Tax=Amycolatopsis aidingensis TaxID=2842453 RepID=UPI001C0CDADA|nr:1-deoxy-D-xylulose-5-phosphate synthase [Amycolatopsis aidingensis]
MSASPLLPEPRLRRVVEAAELRDLSEDELIGLASEIREFLVDHVSRTGGHLGPNLGVVELTIALHRVFNSPRDALVFDTGHQTYVHKMLTGRSERFGSLRQQGGLSGYPFRAESVHDLVENSHASTALSYADGLAKAFALRGEHDRTVVAVVGDGALTGGMSWEALNNISSARNRPLVIVLNDNGRSYSATVGGLPYHLCRLRESSDNRLHDYTLKSRRNIFEDLGLAYLGPVDGHDIGDLEHSLRRARALDRPVVVHAVTVKGKGYPPAEQDPTDRLHAVGVIDPATGRPPAASKSSWTSVFTDELLALGARRADVVCLTAAMIGPTGLAPFAKAYPSRVFDVGIAEQHAVTSAAGLALGGMHPVIAVYATFLNRAFDQVLMDVALHGLPVTFVLDRAGVTGPDGPSHHGMWDLSVLRAVPGLRVAAPRDPTRLRTLLAEALAVEDRPTVLRFPKGAAGPDVPVVQDFNGIDLLHTPNSRDVLLVSVGACADDGVRAAESLQARGIGVTVADPRWINPVSTELVGLAAEHRLVVCVEDNVRIGGTASGLAQAVTDARLGTPVHALGLPCDFLPHGSRTDLLSQHNLDASGIADTITELWTGGSCEHCSAGNTHGFGNQHSARKSPGRHRPG